MICDVPIYKMTQNIYYHLNQNYIFFTKCIACNIPTVTQRGLWNSKMERRQQLTSCAKQANCIGQAKMTRLSWFHARIWH